MELFIQIRRNYSPNCFIIFHAIHIMYTCGMYLNPIWEMLLHICKDSIQYFLQTFLLPSVDVRRIVIFKRTVKRSIIIDRISLNTYMYLYRFGQSSSRARKRTHCCVHSSVVGAADTHKSFTQPRTHTHTYVWSSSRDMQQSHDIYTLSTAMDAALQL